MTIQKAISDASPRTYTLTHPRPAIVFGPYQLRVEELMAENDQLPRKQRYTSHKIFEILQAEGYSGSESRIRQYVGAWRHVNQSPKLFLPLEYDPGHDAQCDWGEAIAIIGGVRQTVQFFVMRLSYSRRTFIMTFPSQNQESFLYSHVQAFNFFGGVPARISYDNLATAVKLAFDKKEKRKKRIENRTFVAFRSHYLFESHFCTPGAGWEKGQVESMVGFGRRNYLVPIQEAASFEDLNKVLLERCLRDDNRRVSRQGKTIGQAWEEEKPALLPLPAFEYAKPLRRWKKDWPTSDHRMLADLKEKWPEGRGIQEFVRILHLHKDYPAELIEQAVEQALSYGCVHLDGVLHCLRQLTELKEPFKSLDLSDRPDLEKVGNQPVDLSCYERLLKYSW